MPGIGNIPGLTIMLEVGDIKRFPKVGNYSSYCRCVKSDRLSNKKKKGEGNRKNGNKYLAWAYVGLRALREVATAAGAIGMVGGQVLDIVAEKKKPTRAGVEVSSLHYRL